MWRDDSCRIGSGAICWSLHSFCWHLSSTYVIVGCGGGFLSSQLSVEICFQIWWCAMWALFKDDSLEIGGYAI
jgi:hypothetical protein